MITNVHNDQNIYKLWTRRPYGSQDDIENHLWTASGLPCRSNYKNGNSALRLDRWITWNVKTLCARLECQKTTVKEMAYPCSRLPTSWVRGNGKTVQMTGVRDAIMRILLQENAQNIACKHCRGGQALKSIAAESIALPALLVVSIERGSKLDVTNDEIIDVGNLTYTLTGVAFFRPGHYTCSWRLDDRWYYYDDTVKTSSPSPTTATNVPKGFSRRLMYYIRKEYTGGEKFDGARALQNSSFSINVDGGVCQQEGTSIK